MKIPKLLLLLLCCSLITGLHAQSELWQSSNPGLGSMSVDGGLKREFPLATLSTAPEWAWPLVLEHRTERSEKHQGKSLWSVPQLTTSLTLGERETVWLAPGGEEFKFPELKEGAARSRNLLWTLRSTAEPETYTLTHREGWVYSYTAGKLTRITAPSGRALAVTTDGARITRLQLDKETLLTADWNRDGALTQLTVGADAFRFDYEGNGKLASFQKNQFAPVTIGYEKNLVTQITTPDGEVERYHWALPNFVQVVMGKSEKSYLLEKDDRFTYRHELRRGTIIVEKRDALSRTERLLASPMTQKLTLESADKSQITLQWDGRRRGQLREVKGPKGEKLLAQTYDKEGHLLERTALGQPKQNFQYDEAGRLTQVLRAGAPHLSLSYSGTSRLPIEIKDALGQTTQLIRDASGQVTQLTTSDGTVHKFAYDPVGRVLRHEAPLATKAEYSYDPFGRLLYSTDYTGAQAQLTYDRNGQLAAVAETSAFGATNQLAWQRDDAGRPTQLTRNGKPWQKLTYGERQPDGTRTLTRQDAQGRTSTVTLDALNEAKTITNPLGETLALQHDAVGQLTGWTDARGAGITFTHDAAGRLLSQVDSLGRATAWEYDAYGRVTKKDNGEQKIAYRYTPQGQLAQIDYGQGEVVNYTYDPLARLSQASTPEVKTELAYDALDRVIGKQQTLPDGTVQGVSTSYTPSGQVAAVATYRQKFEVKAVAVSDQLSAVSQIKKIAAISSIQNPQSAIQNTKSLSLTEYRYDALGRVSEMLVDGKTEATYTYHPKTLDLVEKKLGNGTVIRYRADAEGRPALQESKDQAGKVFHRVAYTWDEFGQLTQKEFTEAGQTLALNYGYDALGRLVQVQSPKNPALNEQYTYDASGNMVSKSIGGKVMKLDYDLANQLTQTEIQIGGAVLAPPVTSSGARQATESVSYQYDKAGRLLSEQSTINPQPSTKSYSYSSLDKVRSVSVNGAVTASYTYDAAGMLVQKQKQNTGVRSQESELNPQSALQTPQSSEAYLWNGIALLSKGNDQYSNESHLTGGLPLVTKTVGSENSPIQTPQSAIRNQYSTFDYLGTSLWCEEQKATKETKESGSTTFSHGLTSYGESSVTGGALLATPVTSSSSDSRLQTSDFRLPPLHWQTLRFRPRSLRFPVPQLPPGIGQMDKC